MYKAYARHAHAKGSPDGWFAIYVGFEALGKQHTIDQGYKKILSWRGDLDEETVRERYDIHVLQDNCDTEVFDPKLKIQITCGLFGIFCPTCEFKLESETDETE